MKQSLIYCAIFATLASSPILAAKPDPFLSKPTSASTPSALPPVPAMGAGQAGGFHVPPIQGTAPGQAGVQQHFGNVQGAVGAPAGSVWTPGGSTGGLPSAANGVYIPPNGVFGGTGTTTSDVEEEMSMQFRGTINGVSIYSDKNQEYVHTEKAKAEIKIKPIRYIKKSPDAPEIPPANTNNITPGGMNPTGLPSMVGSPKPRQ